MRGVSQVEPKATVVVMRSSPLGISAASLSAAWAINSRVDTSCAVR